MAGEKLIGLKLYMVMLGMLLSGTGNTILLKIQNLTSGETLPTDPKKPMPFNHPFVQCAVMFLGELLCLFAYGAKILYLKRKNSGQPEVISESASSIGNKDTTKLKTDINPLLLAIPASLDIIASTLMNIALTMVAASVYQMLRGMKIIFTAAMAIIFLKKKLYRHHWSSVGVIFIGLILVGVAVLMNSTGKGIETQPLGVIILIVATVFSSGLYVVEEKLLGSYQLDPLKVVGLEGLWGTIMWLCLLPIFQHVPCHIDQLCPFGVLEDTQRAFDDFGANHDLIIYSVAVCFTMAFFNGFGVTVTKNASSAQRATIDTARTLLIWIFFMAVEVNGKREEFYTLQLIGFIFLVIGTLVFNEIVIVPFFGFDRYTKPALAMKAEEEKSGLLDHPRSDYSAVGRLETSEVKNQREKAHQEAGISYYHGIEGGAPKDPTMNSSTLGQ